MELHIPPFPYGAIWKEVTLHSPHLTSGEPSSALGGSSKYVNNLSSVRTGDLSLLPPLAYSSIPLFISPWIRRYLFPTLDYNP